MSTRSFTPEEPQRLMIDHLLANEDALLFVGMGVGKTAACLATISEMFKEGMICGALVVAPNRVATLTWPEEVSSWDEFKWMKMVSLKTEYGKRCYIRKQAHIYVINYESLDTLRKLNKIRGEDASLPYDVVVWDELTRAKNPSSKRINRYRASTPKPERSWGLTGTPMPNSELDLFAQVRLVDGGKRLGEVYMQYRNRFFHKEDWAGYKWGINNGARNTIEERIADITLTLHSKDWVDVPEPIVNDIPLAFSPAMMKQYRDFENDLIMELHDGGTITAANAAALVTKLQQFTSGESYDETREVHQLHDLKMAALKNLLKAHPGEPVLVAIAFKHEQLRIKKAFPQARLFSEAKSPGDQRALVADWNKGKVPILVVHPKSAGHGLNLQGSCRHIFWWTVTYSPEGYHQTIGRLARRGQKQQVIVHRPLITDTVDEVVVEVLASKAENEAGLLKALSMLEKLRKSA